MQIYRPPSPHYTPGHKYRVLHAPAVVHGERQRGQAPELVEGKEASLQHAARSHAARVRAAPLSCRIWSSS